MDAPTRLQKLLIENNLSVQLSKPQVRYLEDGGLLIEKPQLIVSEGVNPNGTTEPRGKEENGEINSPTQYESQQ